MLIEKIKNKKAKIGIIGLGYVGLPLAVEFERKNFTVYGLDVDKRKIERLKKGKTYIVDLTDEQVKASVCDGNLRVSTNFDNLKKCDCIIICVPTPLRKTKDPDISYIVAAATEIKKRMAKHKLIVLESTTYPGTTEEVLLPILSDDFKLKPGKDFFLAFSPERIDPGNPVYKTHNTPKVVGGITKKCTSVAKLLYSNIINQVIPVNSSKSAEMVKLLENTFRSINIGLANEISQLCNRMGIDVWEVIDAAATKPFGFMPFYPGPGLGGHCIPIDPLYLSWKAKLFNFNPRFIELADEINRKMPEFIVNKLGEILNSQKKSFSTAKVLFLGVAYKKDVSDFRESPILDILSLCTKLNLKFDLYDPHVEKVYVDEKIILSNKKALKKLNTYDCVVITTGHSYYDYYKILVRAKKVFDTRGVTRKLKLNKNLKKKLIKL